MACHSQDAGSGVSPQPPVNTDLSVDDFVGRPNDSDDGDHVGKGVLMVDLDVVGISMGVVGEDLSDLETFSDAPSRGRMKGASPHAADGVSVCFITLSAVMMVV